MPVKTLVLIFQNQAGSSVRISIDNAKEGITGAEVKTAMEMLIAKNIFESDGGDITLVSGAEIVTRSVEELTVK